MIKHAYTSEIASLPWEFEQFLFFKYTDKNIMVYLSQVKMSVIDKNIYRSNL